MTTDGLSFSNLLTMQPFSKCFEMESWSDGWFIGFDKRIVTTLQIEQAEYIDDGIWTNQFRLMSRRNLLQQKGPISS